MKPKNILKAVTLGAALTVASSSVAMAEIPGNSIILGSKSFDVNLLFSNEYTAQINSALAVNDGILYYNLGDAGWKDIFTGEVITNEQMAALPRVTYIDKDGNSHLYEEGNGPEIVGADLTAYNAALEAKVEADYTAESWAAYQVVVAANVVTAENSQEEVDAATQAITAAQADLVAVVVEEADLTAYNAALEAKVEADYTAESWAAYQVVVAANVVTVENTQEEVDAATQAITAAQADLVAVQVGLVVDSVSAITKTSVDVKLATAPAVAPTGDDFVVKVGETVVPVTAVTAKAGTTDTFTVAVALDKKEGKVSVNGTESSAFDYKAPEIKEIKAVSSTQFDITYSEAVNTGLAQVKSNYALVQAGTANVLSGDITGVEVLSSTQVRVTVNANKLVKDTSYTVTVANMQDVSSNQNTMTSSSSMNFVAIKDETKPTLVSAVATDANKIVLTMSEEMKTAGVATVKKYKADGTLDTAVANTVAIDATDKTKMMVTITNVADYMDNVSKYEVTISGGSDLEGLAIDVAQKSDVAGLRDDVAPTVTKTTFVGDKLTITFSEKMDPANLTPAFAEATNYYVFNSATGLQIADTNYTVTKNTDNSEVYITFNSGVLSASSNYSVTINGQKDAAVTPNNLATNTVVSFVTGAAAVTPVKVTGSGAGADGTSVVLTLAGTLTKAEAETIGNYAIVDAADATKVLAVTKATYDSVTQQVTLTTGAQEEGTANYKVTLSNFANLSTVATETTITFSGLDKVKPSVTGVELLGLSAIDVVFSETMLADQTGVIVSAVETGTANVVGITALGATSGHDNKIRVEFSAPLTAGKGYTFTITNAKDKAGVANLSTAQTVAFTAAADTVAPSIVNVVSTNSATIEVTFNEEMAKTGTLAAPNFIIKKGTNTLSWDAGTTFVIDPANKKKLTIVNGGGVPVALFENAVAYTVTVVADANFVADVAGNKVDNVSYAFTGVKDVVKPTVVSATMLSTDDTKLVITFSEKMKSTGFNPANYIVTNANTGVPIAVINESLGAAEKANQITLTLASSTVKGTSYRVYVANANSNISDLAVVPNLVDADSATALFTGIDTKAPNVATAAKKLTSTSTMTLTFGEKLDPTSVTAADFSVNALTVANAVVQANGTDVIITFTGNTDTALNPIVLLKAGAKIADLSGNETTGAAGGTAIAGAYTDGATPSLVSAVLANGSGAILAGQDGLYSVRKGSDAAIGLVTLTFSETLLANDLSLEVYDASGKVTLNAATLANIKNILIGAQNNTTVFTNDVALTYDGAKTAMNTLAGTSVTKLVFGLKDGSTNVGSFTFLID